jgi:hypothetical protein
VVKTVKKAVDAKMSYLFEGLSLNAADALFEEQYGEENQDALAHQFNVTRALRVRANVHKETFNTLMNHSWLNLLNRKDQPGLPLPPADILTLLDAYALRNQNHYKILLEELRQRFSALAGLDLQYYPLLPRNFYVCFWHSIEDFDITSEERRLLLPLYNRFVMDRFGQVLALANQSLAEQGFNPFYSR